MTASLCSNTGRCISINNNKNRKIVCNNNNSIWQSWTSEKSKKPKTAKQSTLRKCSLLIILSYSKSPIITIKVSLHCPINRKCWLRWIMRDICLIVMLTKDKRGRFHAGRSIRIIIQVQKRCLIQWRLRLRNIAKSNPLLVILFLIKNRTM